MVFKTTILSHSLVYSSLYSGSRSLSAVLTVHPFSHYHLIHYTYWSMNAIIFTNFRYMAAPPLVQIVVSSVLIFFEVKEYSTYDSTRVISYLARKVHQLFSRKRFLIERSSICRTRCEAFGAGEARVSSVLISMVELPSHSRGNHFGF